MLKISFSAFTFLLSFILLFGCGSKSSREQALRIEVQRLLAEDVRVLSQSAINSVSFGFGSALVNTILSKETQDSLILSPLLPYIQKELAQKKEEELQALVNTPGKRITFISSCVYNNKDALIADVSKNFSKAEKLIDFIINSSGLEK
tara:strand:+ start:20 stop:463 length:444 start_codon:yes stop_codon:yes gene_type:complete